MSDLERVKKNMYIDKDIYAKFKKKAKDSEIKANAFLEMIMDKVDIIGMIKKKQKVLLVSIPLKIHWKFTQYCIKIKKSPNEVIENALSRIFSDIVEHVDSLIKKVKKEKK